MRVVMTTPLAQYICTKWQRTLRSNTSLLVLCGDLEAVKSFALSCDYDERSFYDLLVLLVGFL